MNLLQGIHFQCVPIRFEEDGHMSLNVGTVTFTCWGPGPWVTCQGRARQLAWDGRILNFQCINEEHACIISITVQQTSDGAFAFPLLPSQQASLKDFFLSSTYSRSQLRRILCSCPQRINLKTIMSCSRRSVTAPKSRYPSEKSIVI